MNDKVKDQPTEAAEPKAKALPDNTVVLDTPIKRGETEIKQITFRKPMSGELRGLSLTEVLQMEVNALELLLPRISNPALTKHEVGMMDPADLVACGGTIGAFFVRKEAKEEFLTA